MNAFDNSKVKKEVKDKWGDTEAYKEYSEKTQNYPKDKWNSLTESLNSIFESFAECLKGSNKPESDKAQDLVKLLQNHITDNYYHCTDEILAGLGQMYVYDERFRQNIDTHGKGTAEYVNEAIRIFCSE